MENLTELTGPPLAKIQRAIHHTNDLRIKIDEYFAKTPFELVTKSDKKTGEVTHYVRKNHPIPVEFSLIIGDAVHNLRSALDLTMFAMIGEKARKPDAVQFPFAKKADDFQNSIKSRQVELAGSAVLNVINQLKPYGGGNELLYMVHRLDIEDKHKLIITTAASAEIGNKDFSDMIPLIKDGYDAKFIIHMDTVFVLLPPEFPTFFEGVKYRSDMPEGEQVRKTQPKFDICFRDGDRIGYPVIPALISMITEVTSSVLKLTKSYAEDI